MGRDHPDDLEIQQDLTFQRHEWVAQRIGWGIFVLVLIAILIGLFGVGPISGTSVGPDGSYLRLEYSRFLHYQAPTSLDAYVAPGAASNGQIRLHLDSSYIHSFQIQGVTPAADSVESSGDQLIYTFAVAQPDQPVRITFFLMTQQIGVVTGRAGLDNQPSLDLTQFIYP